MKFLVTVVVLMLGVQVSAWAFKGAGKDAPKEMPPGRVEAMQSMAGKPLPEMKGVVSWKMLAEVQTVKQKDKFVPEFSKSISALDRKEVKLQGFMMPLEMGDKQKRFILTSMPPSCGFCMPGGPDQLVEVQAKTPVKYGFEPIVVTGKLAVLRDDPMGLSQRRPDGTVLPAH